MRRSCALALAFLIGPALFALPSCGKDEAKTGEEGSEAPADEPLGPPPPALPARSDDPTIAAIDDYIARHHIDRTHVSWKTRLPAPPKPEFKPGKVYVWHLSTNQGDLDVQLLPEFAPDHVRNAIYLTRLGFYDGLGFHRVIRGFMAQGGDPIGNGKGMPGYALGIERDRSVRHDRRGLVSAARMPNDPHSDGSQFFITFAATPVLDMDIGYTMYGRIVGGWPTLDKIEGLGRKQEYEAQNGRAPPVEPITILKATIEAR